MKDLKDLIKQFGNFVNTDEAEQWKKERKDRRELYSRLMKKDHLRSLTVEEFRTVIKSLWASNFWGNKDWLVNRILEQNSSVERIRESLSNLLYGHDPLYKRYDNFRQTIKGIGPSMLTELMAFVEAEKCCIWNEKPKAVLPYLEMDQLLPDRVFKYQVTGRDYEDCIDALSKIKKQLRVVFTNPDFIDVDFFLAFIFYQVLPNIETEDITPSPQTLPPILPKFINIIPIIVGPENKKSKFQVEIEKDPFYHIKSRYNFISYEELSEFLDVSMQFSELKRKLLGEGV